MDKKIAQIHLGGCGDILLGFQCADFVKNLGFFPSCFIPARDEIFRVIKALFPDSIQIPEKFAAVEQDKNLENEFYQEYGNFDELYVIEPDKLFASPMSFDWKKYRTSPQAIKSKRILESRYEPDHKKPCVYIGLQTSTSGYLYPHIKQLITFLASSLPDHVIYFPVVKSWAGVELNFGDLTGLPENVLIDENPDFVNSIERLRKSVYGIFTCNGPSHLSYAMGQPRLILDPQYGKIMWQSRWKEDLNECIPLDTGPALVSKIVETNLRNPATTLIARDVMRMNPNVDWNLALGIKEY